MPELHEQREDVAEEENRMEVNCNGHASTPESEASPESQVLGTKQLTEEQEDQQNANQPENTETHDTLGNTIEDLTHNGSPGDPNTDLQQFPTSLSLNSVAVDLKEGDKHEKEKKMDMQGETIKGHEDEDSQKG